MAVSPRPGTSAYKAQQYAQRTGKSPTTVFTPPTPLPGTSAYKAQQFANRTGINLNAPLPGTSAYKAQQYAQRTGKSSTSISPSVRSAASAISSIFKPSGGGYVSSGDSGAPAPPVAPPALNYYQAALAQQYGMDATTAYQEALSNTSYQRAVQDMVNAGLNPTSLFAAGRVSGADGVGYASQIGADPVVSPGGGSGSASGKSRGKYVFNKGLYQVLQVVGGAMAVKKTGYASAYFAGQSAAKGIMQAINGFFR